MMLEAPNFTQTCETRLCTKLQRDFWYSSQLPLCRGKSRDFHTFSPTERQPLRLSKNPSVILCAVLFRMFGWNLVCLASFFSALLRFSWFFKNFVFSPTQGIFRGKSAVSRLILTVWGFFQYFLIKPIEFLFFANFFGICKNFD